MSEQMWRVSTPEFECDKYNNAMMVYSPWSGHRRFVYDLVTNLQPGKIVELGSYYGCSAFTFLQAVKDNKFDCEFHGIDTWSGDSFTQNDYVEDIFEEYKRVQNICFMDQKAYMHRMTFDNAVNSFEDESIDILHIDGSHRYEDVSHDFYQWKDKVKREGIILFHDVSSDGLWGEKMGSHIFWEELKKSYKNCLEFSFSYGLGILCFSDKVFDYLTDSIDFDYYQGLINTADIENKDALRKAYFEKLSIQKNVEFLEEQIGIRNIQIDEYKTDTEKKEQYINNLEKQLAEHKEAISKEMGEKEKLVQVIEELMKQLTDKISQVEEDYRITIEGKDRYISELQQDVSTLNAGITERDERISELSKEALDNFNKVSEFGKELNETHTELTEVYAELGKIHEKYNASQAKMNEYNAKLNESIWGRHFLKKMEKTDEQ